MRTLILLVALIISLSSSQLVQRRAVTSGVTGSDVTQDKTYYIVSARYQSNPTGATGDIFAAAMGYRIGGLNWPWTAVGYIKGAVDLNTYAGKLSSITVDAQGGVLAWAFVAIGEFCDADGVEGYQNGTDYIIGYFLAPITGYVSNGGTYTDATSGLPVYYASVQSFGGNFNTSCRIYPEDANTNDFNIPQSRYDFKCDLTIDYSNLWSNDAVAINGCPDNQRKIGVMLNVVGSRFDVNISATNLNSGNANTRNANSVVFSGGKLKFAWDNFNHAGITRTSSGVANAVTATFLKGDNSATFNGATVGAQVIFTFATPKSSNTSIYFWDPRTTVLDVAGTSNIVAMFSLLVGSLFFYFF